MRRHRLRLGLAALVGLIALGAAGAQGRTRADRGSNAARLHTCAACHGPEGLSRAEIFPNLAGQQKDYLAAQLTAFRTHTRGDRDAKSFMWGMAKDLTDPEIDAFSAYYASMKPGARREGAVSPGVQRGKAIYDQGVAARGVLACASCHGADGEGNGAIPRLAGQKADYLSVQLHAFSSGARANATMNLVAKSMTAADIKAVARYMAAR
jgi:cytochrome c553